MLREADILRHLPPFLREYEEMKQIAGTENPELQLVFDESEDVRDDIFISSCNEYGASRFEKMLGITPNPYDTIEARRSRILVKWNDELPYTYRALLSKLDAFCGVGCYRVTPDFNNYTMTIEVRLPLSGQVEELEDLVKKIIPCNIIVNLNNVIDHEIDGSAYQAGAITSCMNRTIS